MLEQAGLLLQAWTALGRRDILALDSGTPVGFAVWKARPRGVLWRLLTPPILEVREVEDESLLCTVQRSWTLLPWREVRDADGNFVGRVLAGIVQDAQLCRCATRVDAGSGRAKFTASRGQCLAELHGNEQGSRLVFANLVDQDPFRKMLLLAAALVA